MTRLGHLDLIDAEREAHRNRGTIPMTQLLADEELIAAIERVADRLATLGARDAVDEVEIRWSSVDSPKTPTSLRWKR